MGDLIISSRGASFSVYTRDGENVHVDPSYFSIGIVSPVWGIRGGVSIGNSLGTL